MQNSQSIQKQIYKRLSNSQSIKTQTQLVLSDGEKLIDTQVNLYVSSCEKGDGEAKINVSAIFTVLYKTENGIENYESGTNFAFEFKHENLTPKTALIPEFTVNSISAESGDEGVTVRSTVACEVCFHYAEDSQILSEDSLAICKTQLFEMEKCVGDCSQSFDVEGEKILPYALKKVLCHSHVAELKEIQCGVSEVIVEGDVVSDLVILTQSQAVVNERAVTPFRLELECDCAQPENQAVGFAFLQSAGLKIIGEEDSGKTVISTEFSINICAEVRENAQITYIEDAFFAQNQTVLQSDRVAFDSQTRQTTAKHKFFGEAMLDLQEGESVRGVLSSDFYALDFVKEGDKVNLSLVIRAKLLLLGAGDENLCKTAELPVSISVGTQAKLLSASVCKKSVNAKHSDGKCFLEGELSVTLLVCDEQSVTALTKLEQGEPKPADDSAIRIIFIQSGDSGWSACKKAETDEATLLQQNPDLTFPAEKDCAVVVYRQQN